MSQLKGQLSFIESTYNRIKFSYNRFDEDVMINVVNKAMIVLSTTVPTYGMFSYTSRFLVILGS